MALQGHFAVVLTESEESVEPNASLVRSAILACTSSPSTSAVGSAAVPTKQHSAVHRARSSNVHHVKRARSGGRRVRIFRLVACTAGEAPVEKRHAQCANKKRWPLNLQRRQRETPDLPHTVATKPATATKRRQEDANRTRKMKHPRQTMAVLLPTATREAGRRFEDVTTTRSLGHAHKTSPLGATARGNLTHE